MRLTVGPLPAAVYWRRRAVVLAALAVVVLVITYSCGGTLSSNAGAQSRQGAGAGPTTSSTQPRPTSPSPTPSPTPTPFTLPSATAAGNGGCSDADMSVVAKAEAARVAQGSAVEFTITLKNISARTCSRDVGAGVQELRLLYAGKIVWSSDDCSSDTSRDVRSFGPGQGASFTRTWSGQRSRSGADQKVCSNGAFPEPGQYELVGRLGPKLSDPFLLHISA